MNNTNDKFYVYRFSIDETIVYVGRTVNLKKRFQVHEHLTDEMDIEYIECTSEAEMAWKEIYYINLYYNEYSLNVSDVYTRGTFQEIPLNDKWIRYRKNLVARDVDYHITKDEYDRFMQQIPNFDYKKLIHILDYPKLNEIGLDCKSLFISWFMANPKLVKKLRYNVMNYFRNIIHGLSWTNLWTTYLDYKDSLKGSGYAKGFVRLNECNIGLYPEKVNLAYLANINTPNVFQKNNITNDQYSLLYLLRFMFQSGLYYGKEINIYIPSKRMRNLLSEWIDSREYKECEERKDDTLKLVDDFYFGKNSVVLTKDEYSQIKCVKLNADKIPEFVILHCDSDLVANFPNPKPILYSSVEYTKLSPALFKVISMSDPAEIIPEKHYDVIHKKLAKMKKQVNFKSVK